MIKKKIVYTTEINGLNCIYAQFKRNHTFLVKLVSGQVSAAQTTGWGGKMKAGGSRLPAVVFVFISNLFFVSSHQSTDLQVSVRFVIALC